MLSVRRIVDEIGRRFGLHGRLTHATELHRGHIHDTYVVTYVGDDRARRYIHQRINNRVFSHPEQVMENIVRVIDHLRGKLENEGLGDLERRVLTLIYSEDGRPYHVDAEGAYWRTYDYIERTHTHDVVGPALATEAAAAFARFAKLLADLPAFSLHESIPGFHDTAKRYEQLCRAIQADRLNRVMTADAEIGFALAREPLARAFDDALARGKLPRRVTHNDTKIDNILFDDRTDEALCIIDLDTAMPGLVLHDFGDLVRSSVSAGGEAEFDLDHVHVRLPVFKALVEGYLREATAFLTVDEFDLLPIAGRVITFETGMRFLTDYLKGDVYFRVKRPEHNLDRARNQFQLVRSMEEQHDTMADIVEKVRGSV
ncbi:MAG: phosphotransferase enzyme family protein [Acidiferrobacterales bacterium]